MEPQKLYKPIRIFSWVILALMLASAGYAFIMTGLLWTGINV